MRGLFSGGALIHKLRSIIVFFFVLSFYVRPDNILAKDCRVCYNEDMLYRYLALICYVLKWIVIQCVAIRYSDTGEVKS